MHQSILTHSHSLAELSFSCNVFTSFCPWFPCTVVLLCSCASGTVDGSCSCIFLWYCIMLLFILYCVSSFRTIPFISSLYCTSGTMFCTVLLLSTQHDGYQEVSVRLWHIPVPEDLYRQLPDQVMAGDVPVFHHLWSQCLVKTPHLVPADSD